MNYSFANWCFAGLPDFDASSFYRNAREIGYSAVEMATENCRSAAAVADLVCLNMAAPGMQVGVNRLEHHESLVPQLLRAVEEAASNSIPAVIVFSGNRDGQPDAEGQHNCQLAFQEVLPVCEKLGVELHFEMLNSFEHQDYQADSMAYGLTLWQSIGHPQFKLLYDVYHLERMGGQPLNDLKMYAEAIGHVHCAAVEGRSIITRNKGIDYRDVFSTLVASNYHGYLGMEFVLPKGAVQSLALEQLAESLRFLNC